MLSRSKFSRWLMVLLCVAVLVTRVGAMHLHLCFDGQEPTASIQSGTPGMDDLVPSHQDKDLSLVGDALIKSLDSAAALPALLVAAVLLFMLGLPRNTHFSRFFDRSFIPAARGFHLRPPLRGPPR